MKTKKIESVITVNNKKYSYTLSKVDDNTSFFECKDANISQEFDNWDITELLIYLPEYIIEAQEEKQNQDEVIRFKVTTEEKNIIKKNAVKMGYSNVSAFLRGLSLKTG